MSALTERDAALAQVEAATEPDWAMMADDVVMTLALAGEPFSSDDVWEALSDLEVTAPREPRAMGPVMRRMIVANVITATGFAISRRRHGGTVRMYGAVVPKPASTGRSVPACAICDVNHANDHHCPYCGRQARLLVRVEDTPAPSLWPRNAIR